MINQEVASALITASANIMVGVIGKIGFATYTRTARHSARPNASVRPWLIATAVSLTWFFAVGSIRPELAKDNFALIFPVAVVLVLFYPIRPLAAAAITTGLFASNLIAGSLGSLHQRKFNLHEPGGISSLGVFAAFAFGWIALAYLLSVWRNKVTIVERTDHPAEPEHVPERTVRVRRPTLPAKKGITTNLYRLTDLYHRGNLSKGEFLLAKEELLAGASRHRVVARERKLA